MPSLTHPLCTPACCASLASLSINSTAVKLSNGDMVELGLLRGLRELTLRFPSPTGHNRMVCISPQRLELINPTSDLLLNGRPGPLAVPELSAFTQIKQLQLVCLMDPSKQLPEQPSISVFLRGLTKLAQLEQLQLEGYSTVISVMVCALVTLPQLQLLELGLCKHPELLTAAGFGDRAKGTTWEMLHPGFVEVQQLCSIIRPKLQFKVGYARQWLE